MEELGRGVHSPAVAGKWGLACGTGRAVCCMHSWEPAPCMSLDRCPRESGPEVDTLTGLTFPIQANTLHLDDVISIFCQVPQHAGPVGGVHLPDEALHLSILPLPE
ncbi:hypothetical protein LUU34_01402800 [Aix galericulata]|nr:hypothetical protein LUU34_01402800 [Aix galericulata]